MFLIDVANPWILLLCLFVTMCFVYIAKEAKNAFVSLVPLFVFMFLLLMHSMQLIGVPQYESMAPALRQCILVDFVMIILSFICYLWVDDIEAEAKKKKSVINSLKWFWKKV